MKIYYGGALVLYLCAIILFNAVMLILHVIVAYHSASFLPALMMVTRLSTLCLSCSSAVLNMNISIDG